MQVSTHRLSEEAGKNRTTQKAERGVFGNFCARPDERRRARSRKGRPEPKGRWHRSCKTPSHENHPSAPLRRAHRPFRRDRVVQPGTTEPGQTLFAAPARVVSSRRQEESLHRRNADHGSLGDVRARSQDRGPHLHRIGNLHARRGTWRHPGSDGPGELPLPARRERHRRTAIDRVRPCAKMSSKRRNTPRSSSRPAK
jgi:hypothetical protein